MRLGLIIVILIQSLFANAANKTTVASGNWSDPSLWSPIGVPVAADDVTISSGHVIQLNINSICKSLTINAQGQYILAPGKKLTLNGQLTVNGSLDMNGGDITQMLTNAVFSIGSAGVFTWNPSDNTSAGASLFTQSAESLAPTSTLIIKKWYSFTTVPLGSVVTGNFGNVTINTRVGNTLFEWNQDNQFETHEIKGTLTIDDGWVVLDKSGKIKNTRIGNIVLATMNSVLDLHSGTHPSSFKVTVDSISNIGGELNGIFNGDGDIQLNVQKGFLNMGNVELIYNAGVANIGTGNAQLTVGGKLKQTHGDFRGIFNLSTVKAGKVDMTIHDLELNGGIFICFYGCNESGAQNTLTVQNNLTVNFSNATDKFRVNGLTTLMGKYSNSKSLLTVNGITQLDGIAAAEFTSSGSVGAEENNFQGNVIINGLTNSFNYGSHAVKLNIAGDFVVSGGTTCLSKMPGISTYNFSKKMMISSGLLMLKNNSGMVDAILQGDYIQSGGTLMFHSNNLTATYDSVRMSVFGKFQHLNGVLNFDDNLQGSSNNTLKLFGDEFKAYGNSLITRAGTGSGTCFGNLIFAKQGVIQYKRSNVAIIDQVKQIIAKGCTVQMTDGNFMVSSYNSSANNFLTISPAGKLILDNAQIISNKKYLYSGMLVQSQGTLSISRKEGLYNTIETGAINSKGNMDYFLEPQSIIEYAGNDQLITGFNTISSVSHQYGILKVTGNAMAGANINIRNSLVIQNGYLDLNNQKLVLNNGSTDALNITNGYLKCRSSSDVLMWQSMQAGKEYSIPFSSDDITVSNLKITPSKDGDASVYNYFSKPMSEKTPVGVTPVISDSKNITDVSLVQRWFGIQSDFKADISISFSKNELPDGVTIGDELSLLKFKNRWTIVSNDVLQSTASMQKVTIKNIQADGVFVLSRKGDVKTPEQIPDTESPKMDFKIESAYPNPFEKSLRILYSAPDNGIVNITMINAEGKICYHSQQQATSGSNEFNLPENISLAPGIYMLEVKGFKSSVFKKLIHR